MAGQAVRAMSSPLPRLSGPGGGVHPAVVDRRVRDLLSLGAMALIPLALALFLSISVSNPNFLLTFLFLFGGLIVVALVLCTRLEISVAFLAFYLGCIDGPVKLLTAGGEATAVVRNILTFAIVLGVLLRMIANNEEVKMPPLSGWIVAFVVIVLADVLNPNTLSLLKSLAGIRDLLQWVPFFFFGYVLMRSKENFRRMFLILGVIALANGVTATIQTRLSPGQVASWGPGYNERVNGNETTHKGARKYNSEGVGRVRPFGLGSDSGFGGGVGVITLPCALALFALWRWRRRRWVPVVLCLGAMLGIATGLGRTQVLGGVIAVGAFIVLATTFGGPEMGRPIRALLIMFALAIPAGVLLVSVVEEKGVFSRYESIAPESVVGTATGEKEASIRQIPNDVKNDPFGFGLGVSGAGSSFGGRTTVTLEGHGFSSETQYNWITDELGAPGLVLWTGLSITVLLLIFKRLRRVADPDIRIALTGVFAAFIAYFCIGFKGPVMESAAAGPFFFFAVGIAAYWLVGEGFTRGLHPARGTIGGLGAGAPLAAGGPPESALS